MFFGFYFINNQQEKGLSMNNLSKNKNVFCKNYYGEKVNS